MKIDMKPAKTKISKKKKYAVIVDRVPHYVVKIPHRTKNGFMTQSGQRLEGKDVRLVSLTEKNMEILGVEYV